MAAQFGRAPACRTCGDISPGHLILRVVDLSAGWAFGRVLISIVCGHCGSEDALDHSYSVTPWPGIGDQLYSLQRILHQATGLPVEIDPPDDPPAGVREPRRPLPGTGSLAVELNPPG
jgi:hypothetical protein